LVFYELVNLDVERTPRSWKTRELRIAARLVNCSR